MEQRYPIDFEMGGRDRTIIPRLAFMNLQLSSRLPKKKISTAAASHETTLNVNFVEWYTRKSYDYQQSRGEREEGGPCVCDFIFTLLPIDGPSPCFIFIPFGLYLLPPFLQNSTKTGLHKSEANGKILNVRFW